MVGSHGRSGFKAALLVARGRHATNDAACPVVVVKDPPTRGGSVLLGEVAVAVGDAARGVRPPAKGHLPVADLDVRMVVLRLGKRADAIHELERLEEARELERALERAVHLCPTFGSHDASIYDRRPVTVSTEDIRAPRHLRRSRDGPGASSFSRSSSGRSRTAVPVLVRTGVAPTAVVLANAVTGLVAALALARGELLAAALLLQLKTLLDNADGQLARVTGRVTLTGRYLDTEADLVVNAAVFAALVTSPGSPSWQRWLSWR